MSISNVSAWLVVLTACGRIGFTPNQDGPPGCEQVDGLVGYWPFDEGSGSSAEDLSVFRQTATLTGDTAWVQGAIGSALSFDGANDHARIESPAGLGFSGGVSSFSFSYWMAAASVTNGPDIRMFEFAHCTGGGYILAYVTSARSVGFSGYDSVLNVNVAESVTGALQLGRWTHIAHVLDRDNRSAQTYVDGARSGPAYDLSGWTGTIDCSLSDAASFGGWNDVFNFSGALDDIRIFNRVLSEVEIGELATASTAGCP